MLSLGKGPGGLHLTEYGALIDDVGEGCAHREVVPEQESEEEEEEESGKREKASGHLVFSKSSVEPQSHICSSTTMLIRINIWMFNHLGAHIVLMNSFIMNQEYDCSQNSHS